MAYHSRDQLQDLGKRVKDKAVNVAAGHGYDVMKSRHAQNEMAADGDYDDEFPSREEVRATANVAYAYIPDLFTWFATPDPAKSSHAIEELWVVVRALGAEPEGKSKNAVPIYPITDDHWKPGVAIQERAIDIKAGVEKNWDGKAYGSFAYNFANHMGTTINNQTRLAHSLALALQAHKAVRDSFHTDIWEIGQKACRALDALDDCNPDDVAATLNVFTAIAGVVLAVPTDGISLLGLAGLAKESAGLSKETIVGSLQNKKPQKVKISGPTVDAVVKNMWSAVSTLKGGVAEQEHDLLGFVRATSEDADGYWSNYVVPKPGKLTALDDVGIGVLNGQHQFYDR